MTCEELLQAMNEYVDGNLTPAICKGFTAHLAECNPCQIVVDNIRKTISLYKEGKPYPLPAEFQNRLNQSLRQRFQDKFGGA